MLFLQLALYLITSYSGGHSADSPLGTWWMYAILVGLKYTIPRNQISAPETQSSPESILSLPPGKMA